MKQLKVELEVLRREKEEANESNSLILKQIFGMKQLVEEFKERETQHEDLLRQLTKKDHEIKQLKKYLKECKEEKENKNDNYMK